MLHFANPLGLWALLAVPVILAIHCLQEKSRRLRVSTLFLLERVAPESVSGAKFERLRQSLPMWMQLLAACLLAWMLAEPRWMKKDSQQTVVIVLDSTASMSAFNTEARAAIEKTLAQWSRVAAKTRWHLLESDARKPTLYAGDDRETLLAAFSRWQPLRGELDPTDAFNTSRGLVRDGSGAIIYVTDRTATVPSDIAVLAVGEPKSNVGWSGAEMNASRQWKTLATNHSDAVQTRQWWVEHELATAPTKSTLTLQPHQSVSLSGELPPNLKQATLVMDSDAFALDDRMSLVVPKERPVRVALRAGGESGSLIKRMIEALDGVTFVDAATPADLTLAEIGDEAPTDAIYIDSPAPEGSKLDASLVVSENHALTRELNWTGLISNKPRALAVLETDSPLLWRGDAVLALQRRTRTAEGREVVQLFLNWDLSKSNAHRLPALLVMLHRYVEQVRSQLDGERAGNYDLAQSIDLPASTPLNQLTLHQGSNAKPFIGRAPEQPGFFEVKSPTQTLVHGAAQFADAREADLTKAESFDHTEARRSEARERTSESDPLTAVWTLALLGCLLTAWSAKQ